MRRNEAFSLRKSSTGLHQPLFASWAIQASSFQSANLKKTTRRLSKARILVKLGGRTKMLAWKWVFQNHLCVAHFHLAFRRFQNLVCLPHMARKNVVPVFSFVWVVVWGGFWLNVADRQAWFSVWRFHLVPGAKKVSCFHLERCPASLNHPKPA